MLTIDDHRPLTLPHRRDQISKAETSLWDERASSLSQQILLRERAHHLRLFAVAPIDCLAAAQISGYPQSASGRRGATKDWISSRPFLTLSETQTGFVSWRRHG
jgi:hypothetical protein